MICKESSTRKCPIKAVLVTVFGGSGVGGIIVEINCGNYVSSH